MKYINKIKLIVQFFSASHVADTRKDTPSSKLRPKNIQISHAYALSVWTSIACTIWDFYKKSTKNGKKVP